MNDDAARVGVALPRPIPPPRGVVTEVPNLSKIRKSRAQFQPFEVVALALTSQARAAHQVGHKKGRLTMPSLQSRRRRALARAKAWLSESQGTAVVPKDKRTISQLETIRLPASVEKRVVEEQVQGNRRRAAHGTFGFNTNFGKVHRFFNDRSNRRRSARLPQSFAAL